VIVDLNWRSAGDQQDETPIWGHSRQEREGSTDENTNEQMQLRRVKMHMRDIRVFTTGALIVAAGVGFMEGALSAAQAEPAYFVRAADYVTARVDAAFQLVAAMPPSLEVKVPMAQKGDLPVPQSCLGITDDGTQAECMDTAYEVPSVESIVVGENFGSTTTLTRWDTTAVADIPSALTAMSQSRD
jgi:hypothetical protein